MALEVALEVREAKADAAGSGAEVGTASGAAALAEAETARWPAERKCLSCVRTMRPF